MTDSKKAKPGDVLQGDKTHRAFIEQLESGPSGKSAASSDESHAEAGKHRLFEQREQHDDADVASEKTRLSRDIDAHDHNRENFQVVGGSSSTRVEPRNPINPTHPDAPTPGVADAATPTRVNGGGTT